MSRGSAKPLVGVVVCCTGLDVDERTTVENQVAALGGTFSADFNRSVTHLLATGVGSPKYKAAVKLRIPIYRPDWIIECYKVHKRLSESEFRLAPLAGLRVSITGDFETGATLADQRDEIGRMIEKCGGCYTPDMDGTCSHLIAASLEGEKVTFAHKVKCHIVSRSWLIDSSSRGICCDEKDYQLDGSKGRSSALASQTSIPSSYPTSLSDVTRAESKRNNCPRNMTDVDYDQLADGQKNLPPSDACVLERLTEIAADKEAYFLNAQNVDPSKTAAIDIDAEEDDDDDLFGPSGFGIGTTASTGCHGLSLDGFRVCIVGAQDDDLKTQLSSLVHSCGGVMVPWARRSIMVLPRAQRLWVLVTSGSTRYSKKDIQAAVKAHSLTLKKSPEFRSSAMEINPVQLSETHSVEYVPATWFVDCLKEKTICPSAEYALTASQLMGVEPISLDSHPLLSGNACETIDEFSRVECTLAAAEPTKVSNARGPTGFRTPTATGTGPTPSSGASVTEAFAELHVTARGWPPEKLRILRSAVKKYGGNWYPRDRDFVTRMEAGAVEVPILYVIVPHGSNARSSGLPALLKVHNVDVRHVTRQFLTLCLDCECILDQVDVGDSVVSECPLYKPLSYQDSELSTVMNINSDGKPHKLLLSWTGYSTEAARCLELCCKFLGIGYTDELSKKNTHLIAAKARGKKYDFAKSRGGEKMAIISHSWLYECVRQGRRVPESEYPVRRSSSTPAVKSQQPQLKPAKSSTGVTVSSQKLSISKAAKTISSASKRLATGMSSALDDAMSDDEETPSGEVVVAKKLAVDLEAAAIEETETQPSETQPVDGKSTLEDDIHAFMKRVDKLVDGKAVPDASLLYSDEVMKKDDWSRDSVPERTVPSPPPAMASTRRMLRRARALSDVAGQKDGESSRKSPVQLTPHLSATPRKDDGQSSQRVTYDHGQRSLEELKALINSRKEISRELDMSYDLSDKRSGRASAASDVSSELSEVLHRALPSNTASGGSSSMTRLRQNVDRRFMLSGFGANKKKQLVTSIEALGGKISNSHMAFSHLITPKPARTEKFLGALAGGKWILHPVYIDQCVSEGKFVGEDPYEWGAPADLCVDEIQTCLSSLQEEERKLAVCAPLRRRGEIGDWAAFDGWTCVLFVEQRRYDMTKHIIESGGGVVIAEGEFENRIDDLTHALFDNSRVDSDVDKIMKLTARQKPVHCLTSGILLEWLTTTSTSSVIDLDEFRVDLTALTGSNMSLSRSSKRKSTTASNPSSAKKRSRK